MTYNAKTIIVVEDEPDAAEMFSEMMRVSGFRVLKASGSGPAMNMIAKERTIRRHPGYYAARHFRLGSAALYAPDLKLAKIPVVVVSAKSLPADIQTGLEAGASIYLTKPVGYLDLKEAMEKVLGG